MKSKVLILSAFLFAVCFSNLAEEGLEVSFIIEDDQGQKYEFAPSEEEAFDAETDDGIEKQKHFDMLIDASLEGKKLPEKVIKKAKKVLGDKYKLVTTDRTAVVRTKLNPERGKIYARALSPDFVREAAKFHNTDYDDKDYSKWLTDLNEKFEKFKRDVPLRLSKEGANDIAAYLDAFVYKTEENLKREHRPDFAEIKKAIKEYAEDLKAEHKGERILQKRGYMTKTFVEEIKRVITKLEENAGTSTSGFEIVESVKPSSLSTSFNLALEELKGDKNLTPKDLDDLADYLNLLGNKFVQKARTTDLYNYYDKLEIGPFESKLDSCANWLRQTPEDIEGQRKEISDKNKKWAKAKIKGLLGIADQKDADKISFDALQDLGLVVVNEDGLFSFKDPFPNDEFSIRLMQKKGLSEKIGDRTQRKHYDYTVDLFSGLDHHEKFNFPKDFNKALYDKQTKENIIDKIKKILGSDAEISTGFSIETLKHRYLISEKDGQYFIWDSESKTLEKWKKMFSGFDKMTEEQFKDFVREFNTDSFFDATQAQATLGVERLKEFNAGKDLIKLIGRAKADASQPITEEEKKIIHNTITELRYKVSNLGNHDELLERFMAREFVKLVDSLPEKLLKEKIIKNEGTINQIKDKVINHADIGTPKPMSMWAKVGSTAIGVALAGALITLFVVCGKTMKKDNKAQKK